MNALWCFPAKDRSEKDMWQYMRLSHEVCGAMFQTFTARYESHGVLPGLPDNPGLHSHVRQTASGDWLALKYDCTELKDRLSRQFQACVKKRGSVMNAIANSYCEVSGIPQLVVLDSLGRQVIGRPYCARGIPGLILRGCPRCSRGSHGSCQCIVHAGRAARLLTSLQQPPVCHRS